MAGVASAAISGSAAVADDANGTAVINNPMLAMVAASRRRVRLSVVRRDGAMCKEIPPRVTGDTSGDWSRLWPRAGNHFGNGRQGA